MSLPDISVIIPARDEVAALTDLIAGVETALKGHRYEIIVIDDGSSDGTGHLLTRLTVRHPALRWKRNEVAIGQSGSIRRGVRDSRAPLIVTLDGDGQNPPDQIPLLLAPFVGPGVDDLGLVQGQRLGRKDTAGKRWASRAANAIRGFLLKDGVQDSGCGLKAFRRTAYDSLPWFDHIHRFMPAMMQREGWEVRTVSVTHRARDGGASKYTNLGRALVGIPDLLGAAWLIRRSDPSARAAVRTADLADAAALNSTERGQR